MSNEKIPMIYSAICGVMEDVGAVGKDDYNKTQGFKYRGIDAVMNALNPAMIKHKVFCVPEVLEQNREDRKTIKGSSLIYSVCKIRYRFFTTDGSFVEAVVVGEGMDSGDKSTNKAMAVAFKYACFQIFCIPTENLMDDPDAETPELGTNSKKEDKKPIYITESQIKKLCKEIDRTGWNIDELLSYLRVKEVEKITEEKFNYVMKKLGEKPDKVPPPTPEPPPDIPDGYDADLPFN